MSINRCDTTCCDTPLDDEWDRPESDLLTFEAYQAMPGVRQRDGSWAGDTRFRCDLCEVCGCIYVVWYRRSHVDSDWTPCDSSYWHSFNDEPWPEDGTPRPVVEIVRELRAALAAAGGKV